jgi:hypothetical protein
MEDPFATRFNLAVLPEVPCPNLQMPPSVDFNNVAAVKGYVLGHLERMYPGHSGALVGRLFDDAARNFSGRGDRFLSVDLPYHNFAHTCMVAVCITLIYEGMQLSEFETKPDFRDLEVALTAVLLHDIGYLKEKADTQGTGAKYTALHIPRSCAYASEYLPGLGFTPLEAERIRTAILCTGPLADLTKIPFPDEKARALGCALATADYLSQLADPRYPTMLAALFGEFAESDEFMKVPADKRVFKSLDDLTRRTPSFWRKLVQPKLEHDFRGFARFLERPVGSGDNGYLNAVEANIHAIEAFSGKPPSP